MLRGPSRQQQAARQRCSVLVLLQVRADCMPRKLLEYMCSEAGLAASNAAAAGERSKAQEDLLLEQVREALGCKHVIRVCTNHDQSRVMGAAERLLQHAAAIRGSVNLSGGCSGLCMLRSVGVCWCGQSRVRGPAVQLLQ